MNPLLEQFLSEAREYLQGIGERLLDLEGDPRNPALLAELFRLVHTLKGNSGLFEFPEMTRVLHAGEDLLDAVRDGRAEYSPQMADRLLATMDFVSALLDEIEVAGVAAGSIAHAATATELAQALRSLIGAGRTPPCVAAEAGAGTATATRSRDDDTPVDVGAIAQARDTGARMTAAGMPVAVRAELLRSVAAGTALHWLEYTPDAECFFSGEDPLFQARQVPGALWTSVAAKAPWPALAELDAYRCQLTFRFVTAAAEAELRSLFRYTPDAIRLVRLTREALACDDAAGLAPRPGSGVDAAASGQAVAPVMPASSAPAQVAAAGALHAAIAAQREILRLPFADAWAPGRVKAVAATLRACLAAVGRSAAQPRLDAALAATLAGSDATALQAWLDTEFPGAGTAAEPAGAGTSRADATAAPTLAPAASTGPATGEPPEQEVKYGRRSDDVQAGAKHLKVEQAKIDRLMNLIGEMVVAKNSLPYLAARAEHQYGVRELAREVKAQHAVINRIAEEMQDAIMQVRMMPLSFVFQRFPRLVRDTSRRLGKEVQLLLDGEETAADKSIVEALADPLIHIIRNSLDHGIELPAARRAAGKPETGRLTIRAAQESDRVRIEIADDGKGIDPNVIRRKAVERGLIDQATADRMPDQAAVELVFAAGFSTAETVSDLSGRGVGLDVVRSAMEKANGSVGITSEAGKGTCIRLSLPLSMAVSNVIVVESDRQIFGIPMESVVETVRVPRRAIRSIKQRRTTVLRGRIVPLLSLNELLAVPAEQQPNGDDEFATLVVRVQNAHVGIVVDGFRETVDIILKPLAGLLGNLPGYAGSALLGDGSVLMVLNPKELV